MTNRPATRAADLSNKFTLIAALKEDKAVGKMLGIKNMTDNYEVDLCVLNGCAI